MKRLLLICIFGIFILSVAGAAYVWMNFVNKPASTISEEITYEIPPGTSFRTVTKDLAKKGLIKNSDLFLILAKIKGEGSRMRVGEYLLNKNMKPTEILDIINSGKSIEYKITIAEGLSIYEVADLMAETKLVTAAEFLKTVTDKAFVKSLLGSEYRSLEGYLFPETYQYTKFTDYHDLIRQMVAKFKEAYKSVEIFNKLGMSRHDIVTLASIIEKETGAPKERSLISSVFHNRIRKGMMLQTDPTIIYGKAIESGKIEIRISKSDLSRYTDYNTYVIKGLPPGPISNPGKDALLAAVQPAESAYLYFVSHNDGTHQFSEDYKAHLKAVQKFQLDPKAREGKSWRDLNKPTN